MFVKQIHTNKNSFNEKKSHNLLHSVKKENINFETL